MNSSEEIKRPSKEEQKAALSSYDSLTSLLEEVHTDFPEIEIEETSERIKVPLNALKLLATILKETGKGNPVSIVPVATEVTTQAAAEMLGCSRPHIVNLLEKGEIKFTKIGKHRRIKYDDVLNYKKKQKDTQRRLLMEIMRADEMDGLYDS